MIFCELVFSVTCLLATGRRGGGEGGRVGGERKRKKKKDREKDKKRSKKMLSSYMFGNWGEGEKK